MEANELIWTGSPDDQTARIDNYVLRAEEINGYLSWWAMYYEREGEDYGYKPTIEEAKAAAIAAMNEHLKKK